MTAVIVAALIVGSGGFAGSAVVALALCRAAAAGDRMAGRIERPTGRHQLAHLGRQRSIDLRPVRPAPHWRNP